MIHWNLVVYIVVVVILIVFSLKDYFDEDTGGGIGLWSSGGKRASSGLISIICNTSIILFTFIWGGIFWW